jgi:protein-disulfide isomerase
MDIYAEDLQLDRAAFEPCLTNDTYADELNAAADAAEERGIRATPTFVVNGKQVGAGELQIAIEQALQAEGG